MSEYIWAANTAKLNRAIANLKARDEKVTEESVRAEYVKLGGLVIEKTEAELEGSSRPARRTRKAAVEKPEDAEDDEDDNEDNTD